MNRSTVVLILAVVIVNSAGRLHADYPFTYSTFTIPGATSVVPILPPLDGQGGGIEEGYYQDASGSIHGFGVNGAPGSPFDFPAAAPQPGTGATYTWMYGTSPVGAYVGADGREHGFFGTGISSNDIIDYPGASADTVATGFDFLGTLCGYYYDASNIPHGFTAGVEGPGFQVFYNSTIDDPLGVNGTILLSATYASTVYFAGDYFDANHVEHGFVYNGGFTEVSDPLAVGETVVTSADGWPFNSTFPFVCGYYTNAAGIRHGFIFDGTTYTTIDAPFGTGGETIVTAISGYRLDDGSHAVTIAGEYFPASGGEQAFYATTQSPTPEPSTAALAGIASGFALLFVKRPRRPKTEIQ